MPTFVFFHQSQEREETQQGHQHLKKENLNGNVIGWMFTWSILSKVCQQNILPPTPYTAKSTVTSTMLQAWFYILLLELLLKIIYTIKSSWWQKRLVFYILASPKQIFLTLVWYRTNCGGFKPQQALTFNIPARFRDRCSLQIGRWVCERSRKRLNVIKLLQIKSSVTQTAVVGIARSRVELQEHYPSQTCS